MSDCLLFRLINLLILFFFCNALVASAQDPIHLKYSTYLDGSNQDTVGGIAADSEGALYVVGDTYSSDFPVTAGALQPELRGQVDAFIAKLKPDGSGLEFSTFFGEDNVSASAVALDSQKNIYVAGSAYCGLSYKPLPTTPGVVQPSCGGFLDGFVLKLDPTASKILYLTYLGGSDRDEIRALKVDPDGNAYLLGNTEGPHFPVTPGAFQPNFAGRMDTWVAKLNPSGTALIYSTYLGGTDLEEGESLAIDSAGNAYVTGGTSSIDFPITSGAFQQTLLVRCQTETCGGFVTKLSPDGSHAVWSSYFGMPTHTIFFSIALDSAANPVISGKTLGGLPATAGYSHEGGGDGDAFVAKMKSDGSELMFLSYFGGSKWDGAQAVAVDAHNDIWIGGRTDSLDLPLTAGAWNGPCTPPSGFTECPASFIAKFSGDGSRLLYSSYLTANSQLATGAWKAAADVLGNGYIAGFSGYGLSTSPGAFQTETTVTTRLQMFVAKFGTDSSPCTDCTSAISVTPQALEFSSSSPGTATAEQDLTVLNSGTLPVFIEQAAAPPDFTVQNRCDSELQAGQTCIVAVSFSGSTDTSGVLTVTPSSGSAAIIQLSGTVITSGGGGASGGSGFTIASPTTEVTANRTGTATTDLTLLPEPGFNGAVDFSCTGLPPGATCTFSPQEIRVSSAAAPAMVGLAIKLSEVSNASLAWWLLALLLVSAAASIRYNKRRIASATAIAALLVALAGCRGILPGVAQSQTSYKITVIATSGARQSSIDLLVRTGK